MPSLDHFLSEKLQRLEKEGVRRSVVVSQRHDGSLVRREEQELLSFSCNDYFGVTQLPEVKQAAKEALETYGAGAAASRLVTGYHPLFQLLEQQISDIKGTEAACVFGSGYMANVGTISALMGKGDLVIVDRLSHACIYDGVTLSGASLKRFKHNNINDLKAILKTLRYNFNRCLIVTETIFSMDGDKAPVSEIVALAKEFDSWVMTDDAHGLGVLDVHEGVDVQMGTLSKALGAYGGYVCGSQALVDYVHSAARNIIFTTALPPSVIASANAALTYIKQNPVHVAKALENARYFTDKMSLPTAQSPIVPVIIGENDKAVEASKNLQGRGILAVAIRPPTVPKGTARLRFAFSSLHTKAQLDKTIIELQEVLK